MSASRALDEDEKKELLAAREAVWRAWFAGETATHQGAAAGTGHDRAGLVRNTQSNLDGSRGFAACGGKLTRLVFPRTEVQAYGATAILYTTYEMDLLSDGKTTTQRGVATEVFVRQRTAGG